MEGYNEREQLKPDGFMYVMCFLFPFVAWLIYVIDVAASPEVGAI